MHRTFSRRTLISILSFFSLTFVFSQPNPAHGAQPEFAEGSLLIAEFFRDFYQWDPVSGFTHLREHRPFTFRTPQLVEVVDNNTAYVVSFNEFQRFSLTDGFSLVSKLSFFPKEITLDPTSGDLIAVQPNGVFRIDASTGAETLLFEKTFFSPSDAVVDSRGNIFVTEFFKSLGVLRPSDNYSFSPIGNFGPGFFFDVDLGPDGLLYGAGNGGFYRVNPVTGDSTELATNLYDFFQDLQVDDQGRILFAGVVDEINGVFRFDPANGELETLADGSSRNGFFSVQDIALRHEARTAIPEPAATALACAAVIPCLWRRRR